MRLKAPQVPMDRKSAAQMRHVARQNLIEQKREAVLGPPAKRRKTGTFASLLIKSKAAAKTTAEEMVAETFRDMIFKVSTDCVFDSAFSQEKKQLFGKLPFEEIATLLEPHVDTYPDKAGSGGGLTKNEVLSYALAGEMDVFIKDRPTYNRSYDKYFRHRQPVAAGLRDEADGMGAQVKEFVMAWVKEIADERRLSRVEELCEKLNGGEKKASQQMKEFRCMLQKLLCVLTPEQRAAFLRQDADSGNPQGQQ